MSTHQTPGWRACWETLPKKHAPTRQRHKESSTGWVLTFKLIIWNICGLKNKNYGYKDLPKIPVNHPGQASKRGNGNIYLNVHRRIRDTEKTSDKSFVKRVLGKAVFADNVMLCRVTLSQVSSSAALSHSKAFQFMSSTQKDISLNYSED